jgi:hypothetical protein
MNSSTSHRPWEAANGNARTPPRQAQQTLPSITTLTANMDAASAEKPPPNLSMSAVQRDSGAWSMAPSTRKYNPSAHRNAVTGRRHIADPRHRFFGLFGKHYVVPQFIAAFSQQALWLRETNFYAGYICYTLFSRPTTIAWLFKFTAKHDIAIDQPEL